MAKRLLNNSSHHLRPRKLSDCSIILASNWVKALKYRFAFTIMEKHPIDIVIGLVFFYCLFGRIDKADVQTVFLATKQ